MIVKMTKYSFIVLSSGINEFISKIQEIGLVDITRSRKGIDAESNERFETLQRYHSVMGRLDIDQKEYSEIKPASVEIDAMSDIQLLDFVEETFRKKKELHNRISGLGREAAAAEPWGDFSNSEMDRIRDLGYEPKFFCIREDKFKPEWEEAFILWKINQANGYIYLAVLEPRTSGKSSKSVFPFNEAKFPEKCSSDLLREKSDAENELAEINALIAAFPSYKERMENDRSRIEESLDRYIVTAAASQEVEGNISILEGFAPSAEDGRIAAELDKMDAYYFCEDAKVEDNPPVKLHNNWFARLFEPVGGLYELPNYGEVDLTPYFAPFYMLFFGFCLGDMGYGMILLALGITVALKGKGNIKGYGKLVMFLGLGTVIMAMFSGSFFGTKIYELIQMPESVQALFFSDLKMFWFAIVFGIFQIIFARVLKAVVAFIHKAWAVGITEIGWSFIIIWCTLAYAGSMNNTSYMSPILSGVLGIGGLAAVLCFSKPIKGKFFFLSPFTGIISLYDITGVFGDVLSYIRLFGLGTTGGILALVVNSISLSLGSIPYVGWFFCLVMLVFGHLAMMGLSCLGAFVHPVRLTFVEFYKNAAFQGGGRAYNPLKINK